VLSLSLSLSRARALSLSLARALSLARTLSRALSLINGHFDDGIMSVIDFFPNHFFFQPLCFLFFLSMRNERQRHHIVLEFFFNYFLHQIVLVFFLSNEQCGEDIMSAIEFFNAKKKFSAATGSCPPLTFIWTWEQPLGNTGKSVLLSPSTALILKSTL
jgi:hypothetical protein